MNDIELKRVKIERLAKIGALCLAGFLIAPIILATIKGIIGLIIAGVITLAAVNLAPWYCAKVANWRIMALKHEAAKNPIPTLENEYIARASKLDQFKDSLENFKAAVKAFYSKLNDVKKRFPEEAQQFEDNYAKLKQLEDLRSRKYLDARQSLADFRASIDKAQIIWDLGQEAKKTSDAAGIGDEDILADIKTKTAIDSVQRSLDTAFADLEISLLEEGAAPKAAIADGLQTDTNKQTERKKIQI